MLSVCVCACYMTSVGLAQQLQVVDCEQVLLQQRLCKFLPVCAYAHVPACMACVCVFVCAYGHKCKHVCTLTRVSDNVLLCGSGSEKPNIQGHSSSTSSCLISAPPITTHHHRHVETKQMLSSVSSFIFR